jgi:predicted AAA+ superfamily ATPase
VTNEPTAYVRRVLDDELDALLPHLPAISIEGPKGVGKTATAVHRGGLIRRLDDPAELEIIKAQPTRLAEGRTPIVIDEWQRFPPSWDIIRRAVDHDASPGQFLLTGSATPSELPTHSGAGRIVTLRMRPLTLVERGFEVPSVSLESLLDGSRPPLAGGTTQTLEHYTAEIVQGGFPGMRFSNDRAQRAALDGYLARMVDVDLPELGVEVRNPSTMWRWVRAFAAAISTSSSFDKIRNAATGGEGEKPARTTIQGYRDALARLWMLDEVPAWSPSKNYLQRLNGAPKHHLVDPALAVRLLGLDRDALLNGQGPTSIPRDGSFLGALFESLATQSVRVFAQRAEAHVGHLRTQGGLHEVDLLVARGDGKVLAIEVKLTATIGDADVRHLKWLHEQIGDDLLDAMVITTGAEAYRRSDGIGVVPLALLGP